jgi:hypothetical protein
LDKIVGVVKFPIVISLSLLFSQVAAAVDRASSLEAAAAKYVSGVSWRSTSVVFGDFSCRGRVERAILGTDRTDIVVAVFLNGTKGRPEVLRYSAKIRNPASAELTTEDLDYEPKNDPGYDLPGFRRSKTCKGLNLSDGMIDSAHIYWDHKSQRFGDWTR